MVESKELSNTAESRTCKSYQTSYSHELKSNAPLLTIDSHWLMVGFQANKITKLLQSTLDVIPAIQSPAKSNTRNSCSTSFSDESNEIDDRISTFELDFENSNCRTNTHFQPEILQPQITAKLHKKAVHVLFSLCWDKDIAQDTLWMALMIFYAFKAKRIIKKIDLQKTVSVCVLLSCKMLQPEKLSLNDIIQITNGKYSKKNLCQSEEEILSALGFDIYIESSLSKVRAAYGLDERESQEFNCVAEMLMIRNSEVFWKDSVSCWVAKLIKGVEEIGSESAGELMELWRSKEGEFVLRKHSSLMDTEKLLQKVQRY